MSEDPRGSAEEDSQDPATDGQEAEETAAEDGAIPEEAFYSPDDPISRREGGIPEEAFYSPDDPIAVREREEGEVTGMAGRAEREMGSGGDLTWQIRYISNVLEGLAQALRKQGVQALRIHPDSDPVDAMLRSFVAGYLVGKTDLME
jgi:hypothetical protein